MTDELMKDCKLLYKKHGAFVIAVKVEKVGHLSKDTPLMRKAQVVKIGDLNLTVLLALTQAIRELSLNYPWSRRKKWPKS